MKKLFSVLIVVTLFGCSNNSYSDETIKQLSSTIDEYSVEISELREDLSRSENSNELTLSELEEIQIELDAWKQRFDNLESKYYTVILDNQDYISEISQLKLEVEELNNTLFTYNFALFRKEVLENYLNDPLMDDYLYNSEIKEELDFMILSEDILFVPANPDGGFNFSYVLLLPTKTVPITNRLIVNIEDTPISLDMEYGLTNFDVELKSEYINIAKEINSPIMIPFIPHICMEDSKNDIHYETLELTAGLLGLEEIEENKLQLCGDSSILETSSYNSLEDFPSQVLEMILDAQNHLDYFGYEVETEVILIGEGTAGTFVERFSLLYPEHIHSYFALYPFNPLPLPTDIYYGDRLNYPVGINDYSLITGKEFDFEEYNSIRKGRVLDYYTSTYLSDSITVDELTQYTNHFSISSVASIYNSSVANAYYEVGGSGMFLLSKTTEDRPTTDDFQLLRDFIVNNLNEESATYDFEVDNIYIVSTN